MMRRASALRSCRSALLSCVLSEAKAREADAQGERVAELQLLSCVLMLMCRRLSCVLSVRRRPGRLMRRASALRSCRSALLSCVLSTKQAGSWSRAAVMLLAELRAEREAKAREADAQGERVAELERLAELRAERSEGPGG
ncbi:hypothetical protein ERJ75_000190800 [Trypanosoma vivax]|nr:hypothetical protein ERJ75_000190800 [Trypanosoma vivax]